MAKESILQKLRKVNHLRALEYFNIDAKTWEGLLHNAVGFSEETGEVNGIVKKVHRRFKMVSKKKGNKYRNKKIPDLGQEIADVIIYLDLIAYHFDLDMEAELVKKFNTVSKQVQSNYKL